MKFDKEILSINIARRVKECVDESEISQKVIKVEGGKVILKFKSS